MSLQKIIRLFIDHLGLDLVDIKPELTDRGMVLGTRISLVFLGICAYLLIGFYPRVLHAAYAAYTIYGAGLTPALMAAFFWKRATPMGGACSVAAGMVATLAWEFGVQPALAGSPLGGVDPVIPSVMVSLLTLVGVSLAGRRPAREKWLPFFDEGHAGS